jgi:DnaK suppressor protein
MTKSQREHLETRLQKERERALKALRQLEDSARAGVADDGELSTYPLHLADEGTDAIEQEKGLLLLSQEGRRLAEIDDALRKVYRTPERFGRCEVCDDEIQFERLDIVPWAKLCRTCQERAEVGAAETEGGAVDADAD